MNKVIFSRWEPILFTSAEFYLDNQDVIVIPYRDFKKSFNVFESSNGKKYKAVYENNNIIAFELIN